jgi:hypothetical protein
MTGAEDIAAAQQAARERGNLSIWTVYSHPKDFPHSYVARRFEVGGGEPEPVATGDIVQGELSMIRASFVCCGLVCLARNEGDDPVIVESWI